MIVTSLGSVNKSEGGILNQPNEIPQNWPFPTYKGVLLQQVRKRDTLDHVPEFDKLSDKVGDTNAEQEALF
jgi:hypothetical protein